MRSLLRFRRYLRPYLWTILTGVLYSVLVAAATAAVAALLKPMFNEVFFLAPPGQASVAAPASPLPDLPGTASVEAWRQQAEAFLSRAARTWLGYRPDRAYIYIPALFVLAFLVKGLFTYLSSYRLGTVGLRVVQDLRRELYEQIQRQSLKFFASHPTGQLISRVTNDVAILQSIMGAPAAEMVRLAFSFVFLFAAAMVLDWKLCLICSVVLPVTVYPAARFASKIKRSTATSQSRLADLADRLQETIVGRRVVRGFNTEGFEIDRFGVLLDRMLHADRKAMKYVSLTQPVIELIGALAMAVLAAFAGWRIHAGTLDPGDFVATLGALYWMYAILKRFARQYNEVTRAAAAAERVFQVLDLEPDVVEAADAVEMPTFAREIRFRDASFSYVGEPVLESVSLTIRKGEKVALVGASGAGKTTLVNLIPRFYDVTAGAVEIDGVDVRRLSLRSLRAQIGLVTQEIILFNDSVRHNIAYGRPDVSLERVQEAARAAHAHDFISALPAGYDTELGEAGQSLSTGQRQRISIARAVLKGAPILILDEATSALDTESEAQVQAALDELMRHRTALIIAHRLATVRRADRIVVLEAGRIAEVGSHDELLAAGGVYSRLHQMQFQAAGRTT